MRLYTPPPSHALMSRLAGYTQELVHDEEQGFFTSERLIACAPLPCGLAPTLLPETTPAPNAG